jgi:hypothetical protein
VHGQGHGLGHNHGLDHALKAVKPTELLDQVNKDSIIDVQAEVIAAADPTVHRDEESPVSVPLPDDRPRGCPLGTIPDKINQGSWNQTGVVQPRL